MKVINRFCLLIPVSIFVCLAACSAAVRSTATPTVLATTETAPPTSPLALLPELTPTEWLPFNSNVIDNGECEQLVYTAMPVAGSESLAHEEITKRLFIQYLEKHLTLPLHHSCRLDDYRIEKTTADSRSAWLAKDQRVDFVNWIIYSVQIEEVPSGWVAGNGEFARDGWIVHKSLIVGVIRVNDAYVLKLIGTGP